MRQFREESPRKRFPGRDNDRRKSRGLDEAWDQENSLHGYGRGSSRRDRSRSFTGRQSTERSTAKYNRQDSNDGRIFRNRASKSGLGKKYSDQESIPLEEELDPEPKRMFRKDWIKLREASVEKATGSSLGQVLDQPSPRILSKAKQKQIIKPAPIANFPPNDMKMFVSCLPGLEPILKAEMEALGFDCNEEAGGVSPTSTVSLEDILNCHIHLGTASHVFIRCGNPFSAYGLKDLKKKVGLLPWHQFLRGQGQLLVRVSSKKSKLNHKTAIRTAVLDGINESLKAKEPEQNRTVTNVKRDSADEEALALLVRIEHDQVLLSVDTSQTPIHRRGYRLETAKAPLREDLAFAMLHSAGWCMHDPTNPKAPVPTFSGFLDPFCGSGTIAIEAASIAAGLPPGRLRPVPLAGTSLYKPQLWRQRLGKVVRKVPKKEGERKQFQIAASDRDAGAVAAAIENAKRAGVNEWIDIQQSAISAHPWLNSDSTSEKNSGPYPLLVATNPPFGMRIAAAGGKKSKSKVHPLLPLYQTLIGRQSRLSAGGKPVSTITLLQDPNLFRKTGADMNIRFSSQHGGIPVAAAFTAAPTLDKSESKEG
ncbi:methyltransferase K/L [Seminavis robusta]|uniref:Methyltransferase K/L n=1 Tax=Seminavis robusta TaxID=568900 RepID=A0A9N8DRH3_9STRA|nr:methyltransferase K/L [Seminavis robusta]|eukprot:Sro236_g095060.1 methyltransferase K/L (593) ;mRNA; f:64131-65909